MNCSLEVYIISLVYLKRVLAVFPGLFCAETAHNLTLTSYAHTMIGSITGRIMLAHKFFDESCYKSDFYAYLASLAIPQLNALEAWFLQTLNYALFVSDEDYFTQYTELTELVTPRLASEGVFLPPLIRSPCCEGPLSCLKYQSTSYSTLLEVQHQQWKQRCSILPVPPIVAVPVTVAVPTIPCLTTLPSFPPIHPSATTSFASYPNALQSSSLQSSSTSSISSTSSYSQSVESAPPIRSSYTVAAPAQPILSHPPSRYAPTALSGTIYPDDGRHSSLGYPDYSSTYCMKTQPTFSCCVPVLTTPVPYSSIPPIAYSIPIVPSHPLSHSCCPGIYPLIVPNGCRLMVKW